MITNKIISAGSNPIIDLTKSRLVSSRHFVFALRSMCSSSSEVSRQIVQTGPFQIDMRASQRVASPISSRSYNLSGRLSLSKAGANTVVTCASPKMGKKMETRIPPPQPGLGESGNPHCRKVLALAENRNEDRLLLLRFSIT